MAKLFFAIVCYFKAVGCFSYSKFVHRFYKKNFLLIGQNFFFVKRNSSWQSEFLFRDLRFLLVI